MNVRIKALLELFKINAKTHMTLDTNMKQVSMESIKIKHLSHTLIQVSKSSGNIGIILNQKCPKTKNK